MLILGINAYHADSAACLVADGRLVAAAEEERFRRVKHWAGFPTHAIRYCLEEAGATPADLDHVALNRDPRARLLKKVGFALGQRPSLTLIADRLGNAARLRNAKTALAQAFDLKPDAIGAQIHAIEHHRAHLASAFLVSPWKRAAVVSIDGFGDFASALWGIGEANRLSTLGEVRFPHSLGLLYQALTQFLGFWSYGDEYKVMGLAAYGEPSQLDAMRRLVTLRPDGGYELDLTYFRHHTEGVAMVWDGTAPRFGQIFSDALTRLLGPPRAPGAPIEQRHQDLAASLQALYEEAFFHLLEVVRRTTGETSLCLAGGCAMNSVANGKVFARSGFTDLWVQAAAGDAGGAIGAAYTVWHETLGRPRGYVMDHAYLGPAFPTTAIESEIERHRDALGAAGCVIRRPDDEALLCEQVAERIADGQVVGWFQGRMEWGPRALGNRSIVGDPRRADMKEILNAKIKRRESFRPFAPSILREHVDDWFETDYDVPFMLQVYQVREEQRARIPAVTHVDGSGRLQTVRREHNPRYWRLIEAFHARTGVPMILNTSFNENEPVVCRPSEALDCFIRTRMDVLVLGEYLIVRV